MRQHQADQHLQYRRLRGNKREESENLLQELRAENFPNLEREIDIQIQEDHSVPKKMNSKRPHQNIL